MKIEDDKCVVDKEATAERKERPSLTEKEIQAMLKKADKIDKTYFRLRAKAIVALAKVFGKRRSEIASLKVDDLRIENDLLVVTFTLRKKRKRGLFQYIKFLKKQGTDIEDKTQGDLESEWRQWQETQEGVHVRQTKSQKGVKITSPYAKIILEYLNYVTNKLKVTGYLFPFGRCIFGEYAIDDTRHLGDRVFLDTISKLNPDCWMHLFRELKGADVAKQYGRTLESVYQVKDALDLESETTAYNYIRRFAVHEMKDT